MNVLFRADASVRIGAGHVMRCLTLAHELTQQGAQCHFVCRQAEGDLHAVIQQNGFELTNLPGQPVDQQEDAAQTLNQLARPYQLLIVDHYALSAPYCTALRQRCQHVMMIDDLADRQHDCDLLLDQNLFPAPEQRYISRVPQHCKLILGPRFALLREEFYHGQKATQPQHILIGFGGSDEKNLTSMAIKALELLKLEQITADIVIGASNPWRAELEQQVARLPGVQLHIQCNYMATLMYRARLMLGAGGASHWERCICGLPGLIVTVAENQQATTAYLDQLGACVWLGQAAEMSAQFFAEQLCYHLSQPALLDEIANTATDLVPVNAGTPLVVQQIFEMIRGLDGQY